MFKLRLPKRSKHEDPLYYDLRLTQIGDTWFWDVYLNGKRMFSGWTTGGVRAAFRQAHERVKPHKIVTASVNREKK